MKKTMRHTLSCLLALALIISLIGVIPVFAAYADMTFDLPDVTVALDGTNNGTAKVSVFSRSADTLYNFEGVYSLTETNGTNHLTLSAMGSEFVSLTGMDVPQLSTGKVMWSDRDFSQNKQLATGTELVWAEYTVDKDTPAGEYNVTFRMDVYTGATADSDLPKEVFTAKVKVTRPVAPVPVTSVKLDKDTLDLTTGSSATLTATVEPDDATNKNVTWESSDSRVATVDENGKVTAVKQGTATITVKSVSNDTVTDTCEVTVTDQTYPVTGVTLTPDKAALYVGETQRLTVGFNPSNATNKNVTWESSNEAVATVMDGVVTAVGKGTATITVTTADGNYTATCEVTVKIPVSSVTLNPTSTALVVGNTKQLTATVAPANADDSTLVWTSGNAKVATVDQNGLVTAVGAGTTTITATAGGKSATCTVTVTAKPVPIETIALRDAAVSVGGTIQLEPVFTPADTTQRDVIWTSSDRTTATVDANGRVRGVAEGKVTITVTSTADRNITANCTVTVTKNLSDAGLAAIIGALGNGSLPFNDVTVRDYFYDAVKWAVDRGITSGTSRYTFSPDAPCTRAQVVTFLWRAAGCPQPVSKVNPFTDVRADDYFYTAVLWAVENGITNGTSAKTFSPDATVTRAQVVTFLWRANGQPTAGNSGFADVSADKYYATAVAWAVFQRITTGTGFGVFSPDAACTRAQIVTFLYRAR